MFCCYFGRNNDLINSFQLLLTFRWWFGHSPTNNTQNIITNSILNDVRLLVDVVHCYSNKRPVPFQQKVRRNQASCYLLESYNSRQQTQLPKTSFGSPFFRSLLVCETIVLPGKCNAPDKKRISQISLMTERRIMTLLGKKLQKKKKKPRSNFFYYGKHGNWQKYPFGII